MRLQLILPPVAIVLLVVAAVALWPAPRVSLPLACEPSALPNPQKGDIDALDPRIACSSMRPAAWRSSRRTRRRNGGRAGATG